MKRLLFMTLAALLMTGCHNGKQPQSKESVKSQPIVVEQQECVFQHMTGTIPSEETDIGMTIDVPVGGDQFLVDSIMCLINQSVYHFLESGHETCFKPEAVYCADPKQLVKHYYDAYKPFMADDCRRDEDPRCFCDTHYLEVLMVEQTETFVTYEVTTLFIGEGDCWYRRWVTFCKNDGHRLQEVITTENLLRFFQDHPEQDGVYSFMENHLENGGDVDFRSDFGLTKDTLFHQYFLAPGIVDDNEYAMKDILPYLSDEAKALFQ